MSGTGNTKHCVGKLLSVIDPQAEMIPIESPESADKISQSDTVYFVCDFLYYEGNSRDEPKWYTNYGG